MKKSNIVLGLSRLKNMLLKGNNEMEDQTNGQTENAQP